MVLTASGSHESGKFIRKHYLGVGFVGNPPPVSLFLMLPQKPMHKPIFPYFPTTFRDPKDTCLNWHFELVFIYGEPTTSSPESCLSWGSLTSLMPVLVTVWLFCRSVSHYRQESFVGKVR